MSGTDRKWLFHRTANMRPSLLSRQYGNAGIEFALIFVIAFVVFYATVTYSLTFLLKQGFTQAAQEGVRSAIKVDPTTFTSTSTYLAQAEMTAQTTAMNVLSWLPGNAISKVQCVPSNSLSPTGAQLLTVVCTYANYNTTGLLPVLSFPGIGPVPNVPTNLVGQATLML